ncbi:6524_t:CDS:1, partial [Cetraspora pellucida]
HDHIVELHQQSKEKDELIQKLTNELDELKVAKKQKIEQEQKNDDMEIITDDKTDIKEIK